MKTRVAQLPARCEYCGRKLVVQDEQGESVDGNRVVIEADGSMKRACRSCAERLSLADHATKG